MFYRHSIRTRIKTRRIALGLITHVFYRHSIRTRIKTFNSFIIQFFVYSSIVIPLEQGLRLFSYYYDKFQIQNKFYRHSIRTRIKTNFFEFAITKLTKVLSSFH